MRNLMLLATVGLLITGCTPPTTLKHPQTGVTVKCGGRITEETADSPAYMFGLAGMFLVQANKDSVCVQKYINDGYRKEGLK